MEFRVELLATPNYVGALFDHVEAIKKLYGTEAPGTNYVLEVRNLVGCNLPIERIRKIDGQKRYYFEIHLQDEDVINKIHHFQTTSQITVNVARSLVEFAKKELLTDKNQKTGEIHYAKIHLSFDKEKFIEWWCKNGCPLEIN